MHENHDIAYGDLVTIKPNTQYIGGVWVDDLSEYTTLWSRRLEEDVRDGKGEVVAIGEYDDLDNLVLKDNQAIHVGTDVEITYQSVVAPRMQRTTTPTEPNDLVRKQELDQKVDDTDLSGKSDNPHGNAQHVDTYAVDGDAQPPQNHGNDAHVGNYVTQTDLDGYAPTPHGNEEHDLQFAVDGHTQPPEGHDNSAHTQTYATEQYADDAHTDKATMTEAEELAFHHARRRLTTPVPGGES